MFALTWLVYCGYYLCRKNLSVLLPYFKSEEGYSSEQLAHMVFFYSVSYALGQFVMGPLADRFGARSVVTIGAFGSAACSAIMSASGQIAIVQGVNGVAQSAGWPGILKLAREWFPQRKSGVIMAWWGTHLVVGGFLGTTLATWAAAGDWRRGAWVPGICLAGIAVVFGSLGREKSDSPPCLPDATAAAPDRRLMLNRRLAAIAVMYFFVKLTRYAFLFWLPLYMTEALGYSATDAGYASTAYELLGFGGVLMAGYISERFRHLGRFTIGAVMMFCLAAMCALYPALSHAGPWQNVLAISLIGAFTFGPDTLMAGVGTQEAASPESTASAGGFVNGVGSLGQIASPYVVSILSAWLGWNALFACLGIAAMLGGVALASEWRKR